MSRKPGAVLLDTQAYLWFVTKSPRLTSDALDVIEEARTVLLSVASLREIGIKVGLGKLDIAVPLDDLVRRLPLERQIAFLGIEQAHILRVARLPHHHRDPFDRMIVAQALEEGLAIVSSDAALDAYGVQRII